MVFQRLLTGCRRFLNTDSRRYISEATTPLSGFHFWPTYFTDEEQRLLLSASLHKLDSMESRQLRKKRKDYWNSKPSAGNLAPVIDLFAPNEMYDFHKGHFDGVIHDYREMHLSAWPVDDFPDLEPVLNRLYELCPDPPSNIQTHLLHLASYGEILPHIDNLDASGSWILGVSLGDARVLRMKKKDEGGEEVSWVLPSGSVYLQRDYIRYNYLHSVEKIAGRSGAGQRLSIMIRDRRDST